MCFSILQRTVTQLCNDWLFVFLVDSHGDSQIVENLLAVVSFFLNNVDEDTFFSLRAHCFIILCSVLMHRCITQSHNRDINVILVFPSFADTSSFQRLRFTTNQCDNPHVRVIITDAQVRHFFRRYGQLPLNRFY